MAYTTPASNQVSDSAAILGVMTKPYWMLALTDVGNGSDSYYGDSASAFEAQMKSLGTLSHAKNANLIGVGVNAWAGPGMPASVQTILQ
jgi:hypothetical protein